MPDFERDDFSCPDDASGLFVDVEITMPTKMFEGIGFRAMWWGTSTERRFMRGLELDDDLFSVPGREIVLRDRETGAEQVIRPKID